MPKNQMKIYIYATRTFASTQAMPSGRRGHVALVHGTYGHMVHQEDS